MKSDGRGGWFSMQIVKERARKKNGRKGWLLAVERALSGLYSNLLIALFAWRRGPWNINERISRETSRGLNGRENKKKSGTSGVKLAILFFFPADALFVLSLKRLEKAFTKFRMVICSYIRRKKLCFVELSSFFFWRIGNFDWLEKFHTAEENTVEDCWKFLRILYRKIRKYLERINDVDKLMISWIRRMWSDRHLDYSSAAVFRRNIGNLIWRLVSLISRYFLERYKKI